MTMTTAAATTPAIELLALLGRYESLRSSADAKLKSSMWNITKARRGRSYQAGGGGFGGAEFSADDVREELRARALLEWKDKEEAGVRNGSTNDDGVVEPNLVNEGSLSSESGGGGESSGGGEFVLHLDGMKATARRHAEQNHSRAERKINTVATTADGEHDGLRRRRRGKAEDDTDRNATEETWTYEEPVDDTSTNDGLDEEERRLRNADPLNLFGVPPPALRTAQSESRSAVAYYTEVANLAREILQLTAAHR